MHKVIEKFIDILREPVNDDRSYVRVEEVLQDKFGYCAGGVLCDLMAEEYPYKYSWDTDVELEYMFLDNSGEETSSSIPSSVFSDVGFPHFIDNDDFISKVLLKSEKPILAESKWLDIETMNDAGIKWNEIADIVEHVARKTECTK